MCTLYLIKENYGRLKNKTKSFCEKLLTKLYRWVYYHKSLANDERPKRSEKRVEVNDILQLGDARVA